MGRDVSPRANREGFLSIVACLAVDAVAIVLGLRLPGGDWFLVVPGVIAFALAYWFLPPELN